MNRVFPTRVFAACTLIALSCVTAFSQQTPPAAAESVGKAASKTDDGVADLIKVFIGNDWGEVSKVRFALEVKQEQAIPALLDLMERDELVKLENTADLIYPGAAEFYGHGEVLNYDIDWLSVRAGWMLEQISFQDFGFSDASIDHDELLRAGKKDVPLREVAPLAPDAAARKKQRSKAILQAKTWWQENRTTWKRLPALITALQSTNIRQQLQALQWLRFEKSPINGFSKDAYAKEIFPIVQRLAKSTDPSVATQAGHLVNDFDKHNWGGLEQKLKIASFLSDHPLAVSRLAQPQEISTFLASQAAWQLCQRLDGYETLRNSFSIEQVIVGNVNSFPESLHVSLGTTQRGPINGVWWWNPLDNDRQPRHSWHDFLKVHAAANDVLSKHTWLAEWREASPGRKVELHVFGDRMGISAGDLKRDVLPAWRHAGLAGEPGFRILLRRSSSEWSIIYFGKDEKRALITVNRADWKPTHWLDSLDIYFFAHAKPTEKSARYVIVEPDGKWQVQTYQVPQP